MSCQDVCVTMDWDESSGFSESKMVRARKAYICCECHEAIAIGEVHEYAKGKCDGDFWDSRTCAACCEIRRAFVCGSWIIGCMWDEIRYQIFPEWDEMKAIDCLAKLTTDAAIAKMRAMYAEYQEARS